MVMNKDEMIAGIMGQVSEWEQSDCQEFIDELLSFMTIEQLTEIHKKQVQGL
jgi:hypothetical protein